MAYDYFTLHALTAELRQAMLNQRIGRTWMGRKELAFSCGGEGFLQLWFGVEGGVCYRSGSGPVDLVRSEALDRYLVNAWVDDVWHADDERILGFRLRRCNRQGLATFGQLIVELIPPHCAAILFRERNGEILERWGVESQSGRQRLIVGREYRVPEKSNRLLPGRDSAHHFFERILSMRGAVGKIGAKMLVGMDRSSFAEILHRAGVDEELSTTALDQEMVEKIWLISEDLYRNPPQSGAYLWEESTHYRFSALKPICMGASAKRMASVSQAVIAVRFTERRMSRLPFRIRLLNNQLKDGIKRLRRKIEAIRRDLAEADLAEELEKKGNILLAQLHKVQSGAASVELIDIYDINDRATMQIMLDPCRLPAENAAHYIKNSKKYYRRRQIIPSLLASYMSKLAILVEYREILNQEGGAGETMLEEIEQGLREQGIPAEYTGCRQTGREQLAHPRRYRTSTGWSVWAGRNNEENDLLTHRMAAQNDYWFHAHGYSGSHVVLRREGRREEPSGQTIREAAGLAAYWSKGKTAKWVPVVYTQVKYVTKSRGSKAGQAVVRRERTLMVKPELLSMENK